FRLAIGGPKRTLLQKLPANNSLAAVPDLRTLLILREIWNWQPHCPRNLRFWAVGEATALEGISMWLEAVECLSLLFAVLAMTIGVAHLLELPNKMAFTGREYLTVQQVYRGWAWLGVVIVAAIASTLMLMISVSASAMSFVYAAVAF